VKSAVNEVPLEPYTAFDGWRHLASGLLHEVAMAVKKATARGAGGPVLIYDNATGRTIDVDLRGTEKQLMARLAPSGQPNTPVQLRVELDPPADEPRGRGRPKLGVIGREVTLLPRHWEWLNAQPGGASVALRKLVEEARRAKRGSDEVRQRLEAAYHFMSSMAGDLPGFEEASRALFAADRVRLRDLVAGWPDDVRDHAVKLAFTDRKPAGSQVRL
jgi:hypothetical protein